MQNNPPNPSPSPESLTFPLPASTPKLLQILPLSECTLLLLSHTYQYSIIRLTEPDKPGELLAYGSLPKFVGQLQRYDRRRVVYIIENRLEVLDWVCREVVVVGVIGCSGVYRELYGYWLGEEYLVFWRESYLKYQLSYNYEIQLYKRNTIPTSPTTPPPKPHQKHKHESPTSHTILITTINSTPQILLCQTRGFAITLLFLTHKLSHTINSIYKLLLVWSQVDNQRGSVHVGFTHNELVAETMLCYEVGVAGVLGRWYRGIGRPGVVECGRGCRFLLPDLVGGYGLGGGDGKGLRIGLEREYGRWVKYAVMLEAIFAGKGKDNERGDKDKEEENKEIQKDKEKNENKNTIKQQDQRQQEKVPVGLLRLVIQMTQN